MKKLLSLIFSLLIFGSMAAFADTIAKGQEQSVTDTKATIAVQKQPSSDGSQKQTVSNIRWSIVIQCQGKPIDNTKSDD